MLNGLKASLAYNTANFGSYQHREARIIEFPNSEGSYATTFANSIPISEMRFIADAREGADKADLPFYVAAHELTHQWWGAQVISANARGSRMINESITEYITLKIYEEYYGKKKALNFLKLQRNRYLKGRTSEHGEETSLKLVKPQQQYIAYGKGAVAFNVLANGIGKEKLNSILRSFLEEFQYKTSPYPTSLDLIGKMKLEIPDSMQYLIEDLFETVTFHNNKVTSVQSSKTATGDYEVIIDFTIQKRRAGDSTDLVLAEYVEIGLYDAEGHEIYLQKHKVIENTNSSKIVLKKESSSVIIDPNILLIDKAKG